MPELQTFITNDKRTIYSFAVQSFPQLATNIYLIDDGSRLIMVDAGSGRDESNKDLFAGFEAVSQAAGKTITLNDVSAVLLTHGHIDHFGGLNLFREHNQTAPIAIHQLDVRVLSNYEERLIVASRRLDAFAEQAGVSEKKRTELMQMYTYSKNIYQSTPVDITFEDEQTLYDIQIHHAPGHCPGQVCFQIDDLMLTADHVLGRITPHQNPESITLNTGLGTYLESLKKISRVPGIRLGLPGHEKVIEDMYGRIEEIRTFHEGRLEKVLNICHEPKTMLEVSKELFGKVEHYHQLLAIEEAGAHVEYLYLRGELIAANLEEIASQPHPVIRYVRSEK
ncbi:MAG: MBL fold metallo-hydrolase [Anaerolineae bacterium]